jgi:hypothetical protein
MQFQANPDAIQSLLAFGRHSLPQKGNLKKWSPTDLWYGMAARWGFEPQPPSPPTRLPHNHFLPGYVSMSVQAWRLASHTMCDSM